MQQPVQPSINQTFQLSPNQGGIRYANTIEDVNKEIVFNDTAFFSNDMSVLWVKNASGDVKSYELKEIIEKDEKDVQIEFLMAKISELEKEMNANARTDDSDVDEHPIGRYAVTMPNHITSVINGNIIDTFDPSDKVMRCAWKI